MSKQELKQKGFTIIEVVLVLAIAALIFLMVFIALPALQRSQRDTARKNDVSTVSSAVTSWQGNNRSSSSSWPKAAQLQDYVTNVSGNTDKSKLSVADPLTSASFDATSEDSVVTVYPGAKCDEVNGAKVTLKKGTSRQFATVTQLETGNGSAYCLDS